VWIAHSETERAGHSVTEAGRPGVAGRIPLASSLRRRFPPQTESLPVFVDLSEVDLQSKLNISRLHRRICPVQIAETVVIRLSQPEQLVPGQLGDVERTGGLAIKIVRQPRGEEVKRQHPGGVL